MPAPPVRKASAGPPGRASPPLRREGDRGGAAPAGRAGVGRPGRRRGAGGALHLAHPAGAPGRRRPGGQLPGLLRRGGRAGAPGRGGVGGDLARPWPSTGCGPPPPPCCWPRPPASGRPLVLTDQEGRVERLLAHPAAGCCPARRTPVPACSRPGPGRPAGGGGLAPGAPLCRPAGERGGPLRRGRGGGLAGDHRLRLLSGHAGRRPVRQAPLCWDVPRAAPGVWSASPLPAGVQVVPPCYLGPNVRVGEGSLLGPHAVLEEGSAVGRRALVQRSALLGAEAEPRHPVRRGAGPRREGRGRFGLNEGAVLSHGAAAGEDAILLEGVAVWPRRRVPDGARLTTAPGRGRRPPAGLRAGGNPDRHRGRGTDGGAAAPAGLPAGPGGSPGAGLGRRSVGPDAGPGRGQRRGRRRGQGDLPRRPLPSAAAWLAEQWALPAVSLSAGGREGGAPPL